MTYTAVGPGAPYINPAVLLSAPTGISWATVPGPRATADQQLAAQLDICMRATSAIDTYCGTPLRATIDTETVRGPGDWRFTQRPDGVARLILSRPPVVSVISGQYSPTASFPSQWTALAGTQFKVEQPLMGVWGTTAPGAADTGGQAVLMAPGVLGYGGRGSYEVQVTYMNGWPHTQLTADAAAGATTLSVDDVTGWVGAVGTVRDTVGQETVSVVSTSPSGPTASGPGTVTLASPLANAHSAGTLVSTLPGSVVEAAILFAVSQALVRGATAVTAPGVPGASNGGGGMSKEELTAEAELKIHPFRRTL